MPQLTNAAREAWNLAAREAAASGSSEIEPVHLFLGVLALELAGPDAGVAVENERLVSLFVSLGVDRSRIRTAVRRAMPMGGTVYRGETVHRSAATRGVFEAAMRRAGGDEVSALHLLAALVDRPDRWIATALKKVGVDPGRLAGSIALAPVDRARPSTAGLSAESVRTVPIRPGTGELSSPRPADGIHKASREASSSAAEAGVLARFGKDLTQAARDGKISPIIGRRDEILQTIQALARSKKNNPVLVGEAGVGKTAIVEALALRAVQGKDPQVLGGRRIVELDMGSLLSGTSLRGQFEERMRQLIEEASSDQNLILFIDEIHTIMGAGGGAQDAAQLLKPALSRGAIKLIGATTLDEYRRHIEKDPAMDRRFEKILVDEPSRDDAIAMLTGLQESLGRHHGATYDQAAVEAAVDLSMRIDVDHQLPDKAIDLLDRAGARVRISALSMGPMDGQAAGSVGQDSGRTVSVSQVIEVLAEKTGIPREIVAGHLEAGGARRMLQMDGNLKASVKGQDRAIDVVSQRMVLAHSAVAGRRGPLATMLFLGPSGVGKTELARQLALFLFGSEKNLLRFDMSEYKEEHAVSKLLGAPPGYVGSEEEGLLTGQIRRKPYAIVLLDEVEKAHPRIYDVFLQAFDEGRVTDAKGRLADARNCIFILTTNVRPDGELNDRASIDSALRTWFRPELINRIDEIVVFEPLSPASIREILDEQLESLRHRLDEQYSVRLEIGEGVTSAIAQAGYSPEYGARELRRTLERMVQVPLSRLALGGELNRHPVWILEKAGVGETLRFSPVPS